MPTDGLGPNRKRCGGCCFQNSKATASLETKHTNKTKERIQEIFIH